MGMIQLYKLCLSMLLFCENNKNKVMEALSKLECFKSGWTCKILISINRHSKHHIHNEKIKPPRMHKFCLQDFQQNNGVSVRIEVTQHDNDSSNRTNLNWCEFTLYQKYILTDLHVNVYL